MAEGADRRAPIVWRDLMILLLAVAGASVDAISYFGLGRVFAANQTGNTVLLAVALALGESAAGLRSAASVVGYVIGAAVGAAIGGRDRGSGPWPAAVNWILAAELVSLSSCLATWGLAGPAIGEWTNLALIALAAAAMGAQSAAVLRLGVPETTTYITGMVTKFSEWLVEWLRRTTGGGPASPDRRAGTSSGANPWLLGVTWAVYALGAAAGGLLVLSFGEVALALPIAAVLAVAVAQSRRPLR